MSQKLISKMLSGKVVYSDKASHNVKINEHFFTKGPMEIEIIYEGLTKPEALSIERLLLARNAGKGLWNSKDYEPYVDESSQRITEDEINNYLKD